MSEAATETTASPAAAPAPAAAAPAAAPAPAAPESLVHGDLAAPPAAAPAAAPAAPAADEFTFAEKMLAKRDDGTPDWEATAKRAEQARQHLEKKLGTGEAPPASAAEYAFQMPEELKDFELNSDKATAFREQAHKMGFTQAQYEFVMKTYLDAVPDLMQGAAKMSAAQAREELGKVWTTPADLQSQLDNATRAVRALPGDLQQATAELGTNPAFLRAMAHLGAQMREDAPPRNASAPHEQGITQLINHPAYADPKHPEHAAISKQVADFYARAHGTQPI